MGNCLVLQEIHQSVSEYPIQATSDALPMVRNLDPTSDTQRRELYRLLSQEREVGTGVVRIKLVVSKQELKEILREGGVSLDGTVSHPQRVSSKSGKNDEKRCIGWRPDLESIPEGNDI